ncbi:zinc finger BED domain-containing protein 5-like [Hydra vulgaris]|uniref:zinc finger BED domain-containing protein 5-like n=1 Tax=Hydra vulgaris TaxID=6087 RepID=UPI0032EA2A46
MALNVFIPILQFIILNNESKKVLLNCCYRPPDGLRAIPLINRPTRVSANSATLIDNIITTDVFNNNIQKGILTADITDHFPIFLSFNSNSKIKTKTNDKMRPTTVSHHILDLYGPILNLFLHAYCLILRMSKSKKRSYLDEYMRYGLTYMLKETISYPQCVICYKVLGNDSMKPSKLAIHLNKCHPDLQTKDTDFFKRKFESLKRCKLDKTGIIYQTQQNIVEASYKVSYIIAQNKKAHTLTEEVIIPCTKEIVRLLFGEETAKKVDNISLSNTTVKRRLTDISSNIKENVINEIKESPYFSIQLDESTDVSSMAQLIVYCRYIHNNKFKEEFLFSSCLETTTKAANIMEILKQFFNDNQLQWKYLFGITTDGAPAMMGCKSGLQTRVKEIAQNVVGVHCFIHRQALATKTLPGSLKTVFNQLVKLVNYIKSSALNTRLFTKFCSDLNAEHNK